VSGVVESAVSRADRNRGRGRGRGRGLPSRSCGSCAEEALAHCSAGVLSAEAWVSRRQDHVEDPRWIWGLEESLGAGIHWLLGSA